MWQEILHQQKESQKHPTIQIKIQLNKKEKKKHLQDRDTIIKVKITILIAIIRIIRITRITRTIKTIATIKKIVTTGEAILENKKDIKAVIFDLDGTITDTEKYYYKAWPEALKHFGYKADDDFALDFRSLGRPFVIEKFKSLYGDDFDYDKVRNYRKKLINKMIEKDGIPLKKGAKEILIWLKSHNILTALATANDYERTIKHLKKISLENSFDKIICADMVKYGKPAKDIYEYACRNLNLHPSETFAVEDSPNGIESAYSAGCNVIMVPDLTDPDETLNKKLYACLDSLLEIKTLF